MEMIDNISSPARRRLWLTDVQLDYTDADEEYFSIDAIAHIYKLYQPKKVTLHVVADEADGELYRKNIRMESFPHQDWLEITCPIRNGNKISLTMPSSLSRPTTRT